MQAGSTQLRPAYPLAVILNHRRPAAALPLEVAIVVVGVGLLAGLIWRMNSHIPLNERTLK